MNIYLLNYNNYFNRIIKKEDSIEGYEKYLVQKVIYANLKPNDGIETELIVNIDKKIPDYLVVYEPIEKKIHSRWFVLDASRNTKGQYTLALRRDVIVDNYEVAMSANAFIEKGYIKQTNPLIFNKENRSFNQIKVKEDKLFDKTKCGWIVGYMDAKQTEAINVNGSFKIDSVPSVSSFPFLDLITVDGSVKPGKYKANGPLRLDRSNISFNIASVSRGSSWFINDRYSGYFKTITQNVNDKSGWNAGTMNEFVGTEIGEETKAWTKDMKNAAITQVQTPNYTTQGVLEIERKYNGLDFKEAIPTISEINNNMNQLDLDDALKLGTVFLDESKGKYYNISFNKISTKEFKTYVGRVSDVNLGLSEPYLQNIKLYSFITSQIKKFIEDNGFTKGNLKPAANRYQMTMVKLQSVFDEYELEVREIGTPGQEFKLSISNNSNSLDDAPYKMFCMPYDGKVAIGADLIEMGPVKALVLATAIQKELQAKLYDIQLLPYCPIPEWFNDDENNTLKNDYDVIGVNYDLAKSVAVGNETLGAIFYPRKSRFTFDIPFKIDTNNIIDDYEFKVKRETTLYRMVSPNFANFQSFDPYMNKGVDFINIDCTYKPITPYIKLNINFKYLYGNDFNDDRGLILGGDFSLPILTNEWKQYEIQNKNYSNIFDRQQEHIATQHEYSMVGQIVNHFSSAANSAAGGFTKFGPGGAFLGAAQSMMNTGFNMAMSEANFRESRAFNKDMFEFNLQNIQARPQGLVRTSAFNYNNKLVPFIEKYDCTDLEKENLYNKLKFNGMLIEAIGKPIDFIDPKDISFLKCKIIRFTNLLDDNHMATEIAKEFDSGIYFEL